MKWNRQCWRDGFDSGHGLFFIKDAPARRQRADLHVDSVNGGRLL